VQLRAAFPRAFAKYPRGTELNKYETKGKKQLLQIFELGDLGFITSFGSSQRLFCFSGFL